MMPSSVLVLGIDPLKCAADYIDPSNRFVNSNLYHKKSQSQSIDLNFKYQVKRYGFTIIIKCFTPSFKNII